MVLLPKIKYYYEYLFYKFYRFYETGISVWWSEWKASYTIDMIVFAIAFIFAIYYNIFIDRYFHIDQSIIIACYVIFIAIPNYYIFHHKNKWRSIVKKFDCLPERTNSIGSWIVFAFVLLVGFNFVFAFYNLSQIDWSKYQQ